MTDSDFLDGMCDGQMPQPTYDEDAPYVVLFADLLDYYQRPYSRHVIKRRAREWRRLFPHGS